MGKEPK